MINYEISLKSPKCVKHDDLLCPDFRRDENAVSKGGKALTWRSFDCLPALSGSGICEK